MYTWMMRTAKGICPVGDHPFEYGVRGGTRPVYCSPQHRNEAAFERRKEAWVTATEWRCSRCKLMKPLADFPGPHAYCRSCHAARARERRKILGAADPQIIKEWELRRYGLTLESFAALLAEQDGRCAICRASEPGGQGVWHVDHDHACHGSKHACNKCRRGLLCSRCNIGIGNLKDDPVIVQAALNYLIAHRERRLLADQL